MRTVVASEFVSLDGVMESPEKWHFPYFDEQMGQEIEAAMAQTDAMLMGRVNYEEWASSGRSRTLRRTPPLHMNAVRKYVVSTTLKEPLEWNNSKLIRGRTWLRRSPG